MNRVLIVDDECQNRDVLELMLAPPGFDLVTAASGEEALGIVARQPPDAILLDVMMPGMNGYQVAAALNSNAATQRIPIATMTCRDDQHARSLATKAGADDFLSRPVDRTGLCERVRALLNHRAVAFTERR